MATELHRGAQTVSAPAVPHFPSFGESASFILDRLSCKPVFWGQGDYHEVLEAFFKHVTNPKKVRQWR
jgi:hypothetical protein